MTNKVEIYDLTDDRYDIIGCGGTKTVYLVDPDLVVFCPNQVDGMLLVDMWDRITNDEIEMGNFLKRIGILTLDFFRCRIKMNDDLTIHTFGSRSFASYVKQGIYIIDTKNIKSTQWDHSWSLFPKGMDRYDVNNWLPIMTSYINDIATLVQNNTRISGDTLNLAFVASSNLITKYEVRIFCFDFASKHYALDMKHTAVFGDAIKRMIEDGAEYAIYEELCPKKICLPEKEKILHNELSKKMLEIFYAK